MDSQSTVDPTSLRRDIWSVDTWRTSRTGTKGITKKEISTPGICHSHERTNIRGTFK